MKKLKLFTAALALALLMVGTSTLLPAQTRPQPASATQASDKDAGLPDPDRPSFDGFGNQFDAYGNLMHVGQCPYTDPISGQSNPYCHTNCQYPDRTTNPVDGCDNSDPCDPANTKGGSGDCTPTSQTTTAPAAVKPNQCGGK